MTKRSVPSSPSQEQDSIKKPKTMSYIESGSPSHAMSTGNAEHESQATLFLDAAVAKSEIVTDEDQESYTPRELIFVKEAGHESSAMPESKDTVKVNKTKKRTTKRKAGEGFESWAPSQANDAIPPVQPHWGIVPRSGSVRPALPQPPARSSDAAVEPPLWEDRKGGVRLKRGSRFIGAYDQVRHMCLHLMDMRPISAKNQVPRRQPIRYYYPHGMPSDWNDSAALSDLNKALQEAIKTKSNKEPAFTATERAVLAEVCARNPQAGIWDIAVQFNDHVYPITGPEKDQYPTGRSIESVCHEYRIYKSIYIKGEAPTDATEKDIELEKLYAAQKAASSKTKVESKKTKAIRKSSASKMSDTAGVMKKKRIPTKPFKKNHTRLSPPLSPYTLAVIASSCYGLDTIVVKRGGEIPNVHTSDKKDEPSKAKVSNKASLASGPSLETQAHDDTRPSQSNSGLLDGLTTAHDQNTVEGEQDSTFIDEAQSEVLVQADVTMTHAAGQTQLISQHTQTEAAASVEALAAQPQPTASSIALRGTYDERAVRKTQIDENYADDDDDDLF